MAVAKVGTTGVMEVPTTGTSYVSPSYTLHASATLLTVRMGYRQHQGATNCAISNVQWNGVAMTAAGAPVENADSNTAVIYYLANPATGARTLTATFAASTGGVLAFDGWSGTHATPMAGVAAAQTTAVSPSTLATTATAASGDCTIDALCGGVGVAFTNASPATTTQDVNQGETVVGYCKLCGQNTTASGTVTTSWTFTGTQSLSRMAVILRQSAGGGSTGAGELTLLGAG